MVRYFVYLNLFVFSMLVVALSDSLVFLYLGWEGMGFCSYALIGFWYGESANASAGRKAFLFTPPGRYSLRGAAGLVPGVAGRPFHHRRECQGSLPGLRARRLVLGLLAVLGRGG